MFLINCPCCGDRDAREFSYGGDASVTRPELDGVMEDWQAYVFIRDNPKGAHEEFWQHAAGCRQWLKVSRDTLTHEITEVTAA
jgi:heterotetrameric sarcosine oxidase delta subunit